MRISLVPCLNLFLILTIFSFYGLELLIYLISLNILTISFSFDEHLHLNKSPILKVIKFRGAGHWSQDLSIYDLKNSCETVNNPWINRLR